MAGYAQPSINQSDKFDFGMCGSHGVATILDLTENTFGPSWVHFMMKVSHNLYNGGGGVTMSWKS